MLLYGEIPLGEGRSIWSSIKEQWIFGRTGMHTPPQTLISDYPPVRRVKTEKAFRSSCDVSDLKPYKEAILWEDMQR